jgi:hypothetical protein
MARTHTTNTAETGTPISTNQQTSSAELPASAAQAAAESQAGPEAKANGPAAAAGAATVQHEKTRKDQTQCPRCFSWGCPTVNGTRRGPEVQLAVQYRRCTSCSWVFKTVRDAAGTERAVTSE